MGNINSDVTAGVKKQAVSKQKIYSLVNVKKKGILVDIMRKAIKNQDFTEVNNQIESIVKPFLYNGGQGKKVLISHLIGLRNRHNKFGNTDDEHNHNNDNQMDEECQQMDNQMVVRSRLSQLLYRFFPNRLRKTNILPEMDCDYREICWKLSERGSVGETVLHMCLLVSTPIHTELARRIVTLFPKLVNDIYLDDEFYGEGALHMAVVNEDLSMVSFLLNNGADVRARCIGKFFCADDQKETRKESLDNESYILKTQTNYQGHVYWGEYPHSFAACLELEDCYRLLYAKGANPDSEDTNGNTVLHMTVICNKMKMFNLAYELGANIHITNKQGLTPLSLSAKLTRNEMFFHILKLQREVFWEFCEQAFTAYPLDEIDSIDVNTGHIKTNNALSVVAFGDELGHLDMFQGLLIDLLQAKWNTFIKKKFYQQIVFYGFYFLITFFAFILRPAPITYHKINRQLNCSQLNYIINNIQNNSINTNADMCQIINQCKTYPQNNKQIKRLNITPYFLEETQQVIQINKNDKTVKNDEISTHSCHLLQFNTTLNRIKVPGRIMFLMSCILIVITIPLRLLCLPQYEDRIIALSMFLTPMKLLFFCRGFKTVGPFVVMIYKMIVSDLLCFVTIYMIFVMGFAEAFFVIFRSHSGNGTNYFGGVIDSIMSMFLISLNEFVDIYTEFDKTDHPTIAKLMFIFYMILVSILLVNMLIAMMGKTYQDIASRPNEWLRQWARIILVVERGLSPQQRLNLQKKYSQLRVNKRESERDDIKEIKRLKLSNIKMKNRQ
ncbi:transient receptor potential cation channel subfamily V member 5-like, partial [Oppia nitens]|uniref:transient receptor potential cation channel subfamily V member 5-like n=1 Tax=Oppia nitens TaxID=1686743 RepID=UPI0023DC3615